MTHANKTNNEIIMSYGSAYYLVHKLNFSSALLHAADQNRAITLPYAHGGWPLILGANTTLSSAQEIICILKL
jgi:hypothetical protein